MSECSLCFILQSPKPEVLDLQSELMMAQQNYSVMHDLDVTDLNSTTGSTLARHLNTVSLGINTLRLRPNEHPDIFKCIFLNENVSLSIRISLKFVLKGPINKIPALVQIMAWHQSGDKPLSEPVMDSLLTHICVTRPQWVNPHDDLTHWGLKLQRCTCWSLGIDKSSYTLLGIWLLIHAGIKVNSY